MAENLVAWQSGVKHPKYNVVAADEEGKWIPAPGYMWLDDPPVISRVAWCPGKRHPEQNVVAAEEEGLWAPAPGYRWADGNSDEPRELAE